MADWRRRRTRIIILLAVIAGVAIFVLVLNRPVTLHGAVIRAGDDPDKQAPISGVEVVASDGTVSVSTKSGASGGFDLTVRRALIRRHSLVLSFRHPEFEPLEIVDPIGNQLYIARLVQVQPRAAAPDNASTHISNASVRYTIKTPTTVDIGSHVKTFEVANKANVPCRGNAVCSPDGKWKAATAVASMDAGPDNEFRNARVSCIAGPCPFTAISRDGFSRGGRTISVTVLDWADTATFLLQAEAVRNSMGESVRKSYPVIFGRTMSFSIPASAQGTCIDAEVDGSGVVFPIDPNLTLSWADCETQSDTDGSKLFRCELRPGYAFR